MSKRCLVCLGLVDGKEEYHEKCARGFFGVYPSPKLTVSLKDLRRYAAESVLARITVTGVQKKLSLAQEGKGAKARLTIVGLWGSYILKPPPEEYPNLPENEDAVMRLAGISGISTVPHALIRLASGELSFICKRIDRTHEGRKLTMEDFCQVSERLTEDKYRGSVERVGKLLRQYSVYPGLDVVDFFERVVFCYLTGNSDMHLKNYSLIETGAGMRLAPAYDLLSTVLVIPDDSEETALTINGKKSNLAVKDFDSCAASLQIPRPAAVAVYRKFLSKRDEFVKHPGPSLLPHKAAAHLSGIIERRLKVFDFTPVG
jgi:serine/threonine-protein kinase HipA